MANSIEIEENGQVIDVSNNLITESIFMDNFAEVGNSIFAAYADYSYYTSISSCSFKYKVNSTALNINDERLNLIFDLEASLSHDNTVAGMYNYDSLLFWNGKSFARVNGYSNSGTVIGYLNSGTIRGINQNIILEIYDSTNNLVANITNLTDSFGQISYNYRSLSDGQYAYRAYHPDNDDFSFILKEGSFERYHIPTVVFISVSDVTYPETAVATITASSPGTYKLVIAGSNYNDITFTDREISYGGGKATKTVNVNLLGANDNYEALVTYEITDEYAAANSQTRFNIYKAPEKISTVLTCENMITIAIDTAVDGKKGQYYSLILRDANNTLLVDKTVQITLNGITYNVKTGSNGVAKLQVNIKKAGTYTACINFTGDSKYLGSSDSVKIKVNKQKPKIISSNKKFSRSAKTKMITATLKTSRGKILNGKSIVFTIKGKKYTAKTNSKGVATVKVILTKRGTYSCSIKYAGDATYSSIVKKISVLIK